MPKKLDVSKLKQDSKRQAFINDLCSSLDALEHSSEDVDESWTVFRDTVYSSPMDSLGPVSLKHQEWFDDNDKEIQGLLEEKHQQEAHGPQHSPELTGPRGVASLGTRGLIGRIYVEDHYTLLHTKYISCGPHGFREEDFF